MVEMRNFNNDLLSNENGKEVLSGLNNDLHNSSSRNKNEFPLTGRRVLVDFLKVPFSTGVLGRHQSLVSRLTKK